MLVYDLDWRLCYFKGGKYQKEGIHTYIREGGYRRAVTHSHIVSTYLRTVLHSSQSVED